MLLSVSVVVNLALSLLVSSTQVPLGESQSVESQAVSSKVQDTQVHSESVATEETVTTTSTILVSETKAPATTLEANPANPNPWTHPPFCKTSSNTNRTFCVYANSTFANGRGVSIITIPQIADLIAGSLAFNDADFITGFENDPTGPPHFSKPIPGRGMGVIANRTLQRGHRVFAKPVVLLVHRATAEDLVDEDRIELYHRAVDLLPEETQKEFMALHGHIGNIDQIDDIVITNAFQLYFGDMLEPHNGIFPETSRMNHDCRPNAAYFFDPESLIHFTHAIRPIYPGEEITVTYTDQTALFEDRQAALDRSWGFTCTCSLCSSPRMIVEESDRRLNIARNITTAMNDWTENTTATVEMAETLVATYQLERLESTIGDAYKQAALAHSAVGNAYTAIKHALVAIEYLMLTSGPIDEEVLALQQFVDDPTKHWTWMRRMVKVGDWKKVLDEAGKAVEDMTDNTQEEDEESDIVAEADAATEDTLVEEETTVEDDTAVEGEVTVEVEVETAVEEEATTQVGDTVESEDDVSKVETGRPSKNEL